MGSGLKVPLFLVFMVSGLALFQAPVPASAQSTELLLEEAACRDNPHSEECVCGQVRKFGYFPLELDTGTGDAKDTDGDTFKPDLVDGVWVDHADEGKDVAAGTSGALETELGFYKDDRYKMRCSMSYFRENQRRLWYFAVALGGAFTVVSLIWAGMSHMQNAASGMDIARTRGMLVHVLVGIVILASALLLWEGLNEFLFSGVDVWTLERGVFYDLP